MAISRDHKPFRSTGRRILIVEDELLIAMDLETILEEHGFDVLEPVRNIEGAMKTLMGERPDVVTLDMNLNGVSSAPVAALLVEDGIPFVLLSGYAPDSAKDPVFAGVPLVRKPYETRTVLEAIDNVCNSAPVEREPKVR